MIPLRDDPKTETAAKRALARHLPTDANAERATLGALLLDRDAIVVVAPWLHPDDFYLHKHGWIYEAMLACLNRRVPPDLTTVADELRRQPTGGEETRFAGVGGLLYLGELVTEVPTAVHVEYYARIVARTARLRRLIEVGGQIAALGYREEDEMTTTMEQAERFLFAVTQEQRGDGFRHVRDVVDDYYEQTHDPHALAVPTGFADLDRTLNGGFHPGELIVIAARPGVGKTGLALSLAYQVAHQARRHAAIVSLEMSDTTLLNRLLAMHLGQDSTSLRPALQAGDSTVTRALGDLSEAALWIDDRAGLTVLDVRSHARRLKAAGTLDLLIVDYLQLLVDDSQPQNRVEEVTRVSRHLKLLAKELDIPVIALAQLNRAVESRIVKIPVLADLRDSGAVEQDADVVLFIYREERYDRETEKQGIADIHIAKNREGPLGVAPLYFDASTTRFRTVMRYTEVEGVGAATNGHRNGNGTTA
jgi:replicative DNA helicase